MLKPKGGAKALSRKKPVRAAKKTPDPPSDSQTGHLLAELAQRLILEVLASSEAGRMGALDAGKLVQLGRAIKDLVSAEKLSAERDLKRHEAARQKLLSQAAAAQEKADGLSPEGQAVLRDCLLGIKR